MWHFLRLSNHALFFYYAASNSIYLVLLVTALIRNNTHRHRLSSFRLEHLKSSPFVPAISLLVPAHNEEKSIVTSVKSLLQLDYPSLEVIVVNDGSKDRTLNCLKEAFHLRRVHMLYLPEVATAPVHGLYRSAGEERLLVIDKVAGGSKSDAINAALNAATSPYVCVVDSDSILERESLVHMISGIFSDPDRVVALGGIVRISNGCIIENGELTRVGLPKRSIEVLQVIEYLRAFLIGREAWAQFNALPIISGAFGIFRKDIVNRVGGYRASSIGEDFDLVVRMHRYMRESGCEYQISFIPDPTCWTEVPSDFRSLARQRARWQKGLLDTLWLNRKMLFRKKIWKSRLCNSSLHVVIRTSGSHHGTARLCQHFGSRRSGTIG